MAVEPRSHSRARLVGRSQRVSTRRARGLLSAISAVAFETRSAERCSLSAPAH